MIIQENVGLTMKRWIIVSNRLPFSFDQDTGSLKPSSGGLVTAIRGIKAKNPVLWVGSIPEDTPVKHLEGLNQEDEDFQYAYVPLSNRLYNRYYNGFCNDVLWPLLHYRTELVQYSDHYWKDYKKVNREFAKRIAQVANLDDIIWIHDFHLFLVPKYLKEINPALKVGLFLHVPFPSSEVYRTLPCRDEILEGMANADLMGFHDYSYLRHYCSALYNILGIPSSLLEYKFKDQRCHVGVYPVSIDTKSVITRSAQKKTLTMIEKFNLNQQKLKIILGVDRLDYTKGIVEKLMTYKKLLTDYPEFIGRVQLVQVAVPSRTEVPEYIHLRQEVEKLVGEINGQFSTLDYTPIKYIFNSVSPHQLLALYRSASILFVSALRDGMNLVCQEFIAAQDGHDPGEVLLSEFAGASTILSHVTRINPHDTLGTTKVLKDALNRPLETRQKNHKIMIDFLKEYTATDWAQSFINDLEQTTFETPHHVIQLSDKKMRRSIKMALKNKKKLLLLDYDGTLVPIQNDPAKATLDKEGQRFFNKACNKKDLDIVIVSGRPANFLQDQFKKFPLHLAVEHGSQFYDFRQKKWRSLVTSKKGPWLQETLKILRAYTKRTPESFIEKKTYAVAWHFRNSPNDFGEFQARKLVQDLEIALHSAPVSVIFGKKIVEVKMMEANKGHFTQWFLERYFDEHQILALGDDRTDEDMFANLDNNAYTIKVGESDDTYANYTISEQSQVLPFLSEVCDI